MKRARSDASPQASINRNHTTVNYAQEQADENSVLHYYRRMIALRAGSDTLINITMLRGTAFNGPCPTSRPGVPRLAWPHDRHHIGACQKTSRLVTRLAQALS